jgi:hypothetical protein
MRKKQRRESDDRMNIGEYMNGKSIDSSWVDVYCHKKWRAVLLCAIPFVMACPSPDSTLPNPPAQCDAEGVGCLPDEQCTAGKCIPFEKCDGDADCPSSAYKCTFPSQICELRPGFGLECAVSTDCEPEHFCALGVCRAVADAAPCARRSDCPLGEGCDRLHFYCIEEASCLLVDAYPELACDPEEVCDEASGRCQLDCQEECTPETVEEDCGIGMQCDGACRCVQCINDEDCGPGLLCNARAGRCESENLCYSDDDCEPPLVCDPQTALCQVPSPPCESDLDCTIAEICNRVTGECELPTGYCYDDRFEDADTPASAEEVDIPLDGIPIVLDELQLCPDDDDVYAVSLTAGDEVEISMTETSSLARATIWLLDSLGETSIRFAEAPPYGPGTVNYTAQVDETVFIRVNALLGASPYELTFTRNPGAPCMADAFEGEGGNDTLLTATPASSVPLGQTLIGRICPGDRDLYLVELLEGEGLDLLLDFDSTSADFDLAILDAVTGDALVESSGVGSIESLRYRTPVARTVAVDVLPFGNQAGNYQLGLTRLEPFICTADANEPDNLIEDATTVELGASVEAVSRTLCAGEVDLYAVQLEDFERLVVQTVFSNADLDVQIDVMDAAGETVLQSSPNSTGGETVTYNAAANETVLVQVASVFNTSGPYEISITKENQFDCIADALEPNDQVSTSSDVIEDSPTLSICQSDEDVFVVEGAKGKRLRAHAAFIHADGDIDLAVLGVDGSQILGVSDGVGNEEVVEVILPVDGEYYVRVFSLEEDAHVLYDLDIAVLSGS